MEALKGAIPESSKPTSVVFFPGTVEKGKEYIVILSGTFDDLNTFLTKDSLRSVSDAETIKGYLE